MQAQTPSNTCDDAAIATPINGPGTFVVGDIDGTVQTADCAAGGAASNAEWFAYTPSATFNTTVSSDLEVNGDKDTRLHIYKGPCAALSCVGGDDDSGVYGGTNGLSFLAVDTFLAEAGETYYIVWDNRYSTGNNFSFEVSEDALDPVVFNPVSMSTDGSRRAAVDLNGDFLDDLLAITTTNMNVFYQQTDGSFIEVDIPIAANYPSTWSLAAGDYDRNGINDLVFGSTTGVNVLQANADGSAYTVSATNNNVFTQRTNFVDINEDGHLDIFVCHDQAPNVYYINDGSGNLSFYQGADVNGVPEGLGLFASGGNYGSIWIDYDNDHDIDMYIAKCGGSDERRSNQLFRNNGDGSFTEVSVESGLSDPIQTWSAAWADYDNDGDMDAFVGSYASDEDHKMMQNNGDGTFTDVSVATEVDLLTQKGIENVPHDFNNDGYIDILSNGFILLNDGDFTFTEYSDGIPPSSAIGDLNNDGFLDVFSSQIYYNESWINGNNWLKINTTGVQSNINGIGARVEITSPGIGTQIRDVRSGDGFRYMNSLNTHFGIGADTSISNITVYWPSGVIDSIDNPTINTSLEIIEGSHTLSIQETDIDNLILFPNPTKDVININTSLNLTNALYAVFDLQGKRVLNSKLTSTTIDVSQLNSGNYILRIISNEATRTQKFIKQ
jgi:hypothetical protein